MNALNEITGWVLAGAAALDMWAVYARDLMMLQQNSYRRERYYRWFSQSGESTNIGRIMCCIALLFLLVRHIPFFAGATVGVIILVCQAVGLFRKKYKKPLVWTPRVRRICGVMWAISAVIAAACGIWLGLQAMCVAMTAMLVLSPLVMLLANDVLQPVEKRINKKYYDEAASILASMPQLKIIGITGSYGKTSTKHYLHRILSEHFSTAMTPGSYNTTMGVIRTVRSILSLTMRCS